MLGQRHGAASPPSPAAVSDTAQQLRQIEAVRKGGLTRFGGRPLPGGSGIYVV